MFGGEFLVSIRIFHKLTSIKMDVAIIWTEIKMWNFDSAVYPVRLGASIIVLVGYERGDYLGISGTMATQGFGVWDNLNNLP